MWTFFASCLNHKLLVYMSRAHDSRLLQWTCLSLHGGGINFFRSLSPFSLRPEAGQHSGQPDCPDCSGLELQGLVPCSCQPAGGCIHGCFPSTRPLFPNGSFSNPLTSAVFNGVAFATKVFYISRAFRISSSPCLEPVQRSLPGSINAPGSLTSVGVSTVFFSL